MIWAMFFVFLGLCVCCAVITIVCCLIVAGRADEAMERTERAAKDAYNEMRRNIETFGQDVADDIWDNEEGE